jgi:hypothetical protein
MCLNITTLPINILPIFNQSPTYNIIMYTWPLYNINQGIEPTLIIQNYQDKTLYDEGSKLYEKPLLQNLVTL